MPRLGPKKIVEGFLENELNNRMNGGLEEGDHKEYVREARWAAYVSAWVWVSTLLYQSLRKKFPSGD